MEQMKEMVVMAAMLLILFEIYSHTKENKAKINGGLQQWNIYIWRKPRVNTLLTDISNKTYVFFFCRRNLPNINPLPKQL